MDTLQKVKSELSNFHDHKRGNDLSKFFKAFPGGYGEGDSFIGVTVPNQRLVSKKYFKEIRHEEIGILLKDNFHECRLTALFMLVLRYQKSRNDEERESIVKLYLDNLVHINNWDLVDSSAHLILGDYLLNRDKKVLYDLAVSNNLWFQRISIIATFQFIRKKQLDDTLRISGILLNHKHDLIHKAVGWMLREAGNRNFDVEFNFLKKHYKSMPRTMLRYAIEKFPEELRQDFLKGRV